MQRQLHNAASTTQLLTYSTLYSTEHPTDARGVLLAPQTASHAKRKAFYSIRSTAPPQTEQGRAEALGRVDPSLSGEASFGEHLPSTQLPLRRAGGVPAVFLWARSPPSVASTRCPIRCPTVAAEDDACRRDLGEAESSSPCAATGYETLAPGELTADQAARVHTLPRSL